MITNLFTQVPGAVPALVIDKVKELEQLSTRMPPALVNALASAYAAGTSDAHCMPVMADGQVMSGAVFALTVTVTDAVAEQPLVEVVFVTV